MVPHAYALITAGDKYDVNLYVVPVLTASPTHIYGMALRLNRTKLTPPTPALQEPSRSSPATRPLTRWYVPSYIHTYTSLFPSSTNPQQKLNRFRRAKAASANGFETLGLYAAGIVAANASGVPTATVNKLALGYIASRVVFNYIYVFLQDNRKFAPLRTLVWMAGIAMIFMLYTSAGRAIAL